MFDEKVLKWFDYHGIRRPDHFPHGVTDTQENPLSKQIPRLKTWNWRMEGNVLKCDTSEGPFTQIIQSTDYICQGTGPDGMPILTKVQPK